MRHLIVSSFRAVLSDPESLATSLIGFAIGLAGFVTIILFIAQEIGHDRWLADAERIYRIETKEIYPGRAPLEVARVPGPLAGALEEEFHEIEAITRGFIASVRLERDTRFHEVEVLAADPNFFDVIALPFEAGGPDALSETSAILLSRSAALSLFGRPDPLGEIVTMQADRVRDFEVAGVFSDIPDNSHMAFDYVISHAAYFDPADAGGAGFIPDQWGGAYFHTYMKLRPGADPAQIQSELPALIDERLPDSLAELIGVAPHEFFQLRLIAAPDIHLHGYDLAGMKPGGDPVALSVFALVAVMVLVIATVNLSSVMAARLLARRRELSIRKIVGAGARSLLGLVLVEAVLYGLAALVLGAGLVVFLLQADAAFLGDVIWMAPFAHWWSWAALLGAGLGVPVAAALYPATRAALTHPREIFASGRSSTGGAQWGQRVLLGLQMIATLGLVSFSLIVMDQMRQAQSVELGFQPQQMLVFREPEQRSGNAGSDVLRARLAQIPGVVEAARSSAVPFVRASGSDANTSVRSPQADQAVTIGFYRVDLSFFDTYDIAPLAGRLFSPDRRGDLASRPGEGGGVVINRTALARLGYQRPEQAVGESLSAGSARYMIIGVIDDLRFRSTFEGQREEVFFAQPDPGRWLSVRFNPEDTSAVLRGLNALWAEQYPGWDIEYIFLEDAVGAAYSGLRLQLVLLSAFAGLALALTAIGLYGVTAFSTRRRAPEMALRRILGATPAQIVRLFAVDLLAPLLAAMIIALPLSWLISQAWRARFPGAVDGALWPYLAALMLVVLVLVPIVLQQAWRIARLAPARVFNQD